MSIVKF